MSRVKEINSFKKLAKVLDVFLKIIYWMIIIVIPIFIVIALMINLTPKSWVKDIAESGSMFASFGALDIDIDASILGYENVVNIFNLSLIPGIICGCIFIFIIRQVRGILKNAINEIPFSKTSIKYIRNLGYGVIIGGVIFNILMSISEFISLRIIQIEDLLFSTELVKDVKINLLVIDWQTVLIGLFILLLAQIFKYGCYLQEEYDATL